MLDRIDKDRLGQALDAADFLLEHLGDDGVIRIEDSWAPENPAYLSETPWVFLEAFKLTGDEKYRHGTTRIFDHMRDTQKPDGSWYRTIENANWILINGAVAYGVRKYEKITGDDSYRPMIDRAFSYMCSCWDSDTGFWEHIPRTRYEESICLLGLWSWRNIREEADRLAPKVVEHITTHPSIWDGEKKYWIPNGLVKGRELATPSFTAITSCAILATTADQYASSHVKPALDHVLGNPLLKCDHIPGGYHIGQEAYLDEANVRGATALATAMKLFDLTTESTTFSSSSEYAKICAWIDGMKAEHGFYEYQSNSDHSRHAQGSPAQYIPCWWIFGQF